MRPDTLKLLFDMRVAASGIQLFVGNFSLEKFKSDLMVKLAVEREFEIIGEALGRLLKSNASLAESISEHRRIIGFRNQLIHGYDTISDDITWGIIQEKLPILIRELDGLITTAKLDDYAI